MAESERSGILSRTTRVLAIAVVIGAIVIALFQALFPEVEAAEALAVIALVSLAAALALHAFWTRRASRRKK